MLIPDLIIQLIAVVIGVALYATIFKILKNIIYNKETYCGGKQ